MEALTVLGSVLLGSLIVILSDSIRLRYSVKLEKEKLLWNHRMEKIMELERLASYLTEYLSGYKPISGKEDLLENYYTEIELISGGFLRYPKLVQASRDYLNRAGRMLKNKVNGQPVEDENILVQELSTTFKKLIERVRQYLRIVNNI